MISVKTQPLSKEQRWRRACGRQVDAGRQHVAGLDAAQRDVPHARRRVDVHVEGACRGGGRVSPTVTGQVAGPSRTCPPAALVRQDELNKSLCQHNKLVAKNIS